MRDPRSDFYARRHRERCAALPWTRAQALAYVGVAVACLAAVAVEPYRSWIVASYVLAFLFAVAVLLRMVALVLGLLRDPTLRVAPAAGDDLPVYTVLVPLLDEPEVVPRLLGALRALDYPPDRLDVQFLCEHDDAATIAALRDAGLPAHMRITTAPPGPPRTKPRVCNEGLAAARGEFVVIYDAEDRPDPDQLRGEEALGIGALPAHRGQVAVEEPVALDLPRQGRLADPPDPRQPHDRSPLPGLPDRPDPIPPIDHNDNLQKLK